MPRLLFILHGMGVHDTDWATPTVDHLQKIPSDYGYEWFDANGPLEDHVKCVPISYDHAFTELLAQWAESADELEQFGDTEGVGIVKSLSFLHGASPAEQQFFWTSVVDVLLYRLFPIVTANVRRIVRDEITKRFTEEAAAGSIVDVSIMAHSLGTSVAHDSLSILATQPIQTPAGPNQSFMLGNFQFKRIFQVANVSRVLQTTPAVLASPIHPFTADPATSYTRGFLNFKHRYDLFTMVRPFTAPAAWGGGFLEPAGINRILGFNVHDLDHYLENPRVHVPILRQLIDPAVVTPDEEADALGAYDAKPEPDCLVQLDAFKDRIDDLIAQASTSLDLQDLVIALTKALAAAKEAKNACV
jgi:hypothetical protein